LILRVLVLVTLVFSLLSRNIESAATCVLVLILFLVPAFVEQRMKIVIPALLQGIVLLFIFAAEILGEVNHYFVRIRGWDTMLHTLNGFLCAAVGFSLVELLNDRNGHVHLSPLYLTLVAFCFSMTIGVLWEFFECAVDLLLRQDMQKDMLVQGFSSAAMDPSGTGRVRVAGILRTVIVTEGGEYVIEGGYLDIGLLDTMKDLLVNFIGAVAYSFIGYFSLKRRRESAITRGLTLHRSAPPDDAP